MSKKINEIMTSQVEVVYPETNLRDAAAKMKELDVGALPVKEGDNVVGIVTDRDIVLKAMTEGCDPVITQVSTVMSSPVVFCYENQDVEDAANIMEAKQIRRLVVYNEAMKLVGIVSLGDIVLKAGRELSSEILDKISEDHRKPAA